MFIKNVCYCHLIKLILKKIALHLSAFDFSKQTGRKKHCNTWHRICRFNIGKSQKVLYSMYVGIKALLDCKCLKVNYTAARGIVLLSEGSRLFVTLLSPTPPSTNLMS